MFSHSSPSHFISKLSSKFFISLRVCYFVVGVLTGLETQSHSSSVIGCQLHMCFTFPCCNRLTFHVMITCFVAIFDLHLLKLLTCSWVIPYWDCNILAALVRPIISHRLIILSHIRIYLYVQFRHYKYD